MEQEEKGDKNVEEKMEEEKPGEGQSESDSDEEENLLAADPGEEEGGDVEETVTDELLKDNDEIEMEQQEEVKEIRIDEEVKMTKEEQRGREEVTTFMQVKDRSDPLDVNPSKSFENLAIDDQKDMELSDQGITDHNENSTHNNKAEAMVDIVTKANPGCNMSHLAQPLTLNKTSAADVDEKEKEKKDKDGESDSITTEADGTEVEEEDEVEMDEVEIVGEFSNKEMVEGVEEKKEKEGAGGDGDHWGSTDRRTKEVKAEV